MYFAGDRVEVMRSPRRLVNYGGTSIFTWSFCPVGRGTVVEGQDGDGNITVRPDSYQSSHWVVHPMDVKLVEAFVKEGI